jgi:outer membrane protein with beta-barrel domain
MSRRLLAVLAASALLALPAASRAQSILVSGGLSVPMSDLSDYSNSGYNVNLGLAFGAPIIPVGARIEGGFSSFEGKGGAASGTTTRIASATANAVLNLGPTGAAPYLIGGLGIYNRRFSSDLTDASDSKTSAGVNIGGGIRFPLGGISTFLEARYHVMLGNQEEGTNLQFIPISFGIQF